MKNVLNKEYRALLRGRYAGKVYAFGEGLLKNGVCGDDFFYIMQGGEEITATAKKQRQEWFDAATRRMEERIEAKRLKEVRENSACCLGGKRDELAREICAKYPTVDERFAALSRERFIIGGKAWKDEETNTYYISFWYARPAEGYRCSCLHYYPKTQPMTKTWCMCCGGHIKHHFETALGVKAEVSIVDTILTTCGERPCLFAFTVLEENKA